MDARHHGRPLLLRVGVIGCAVVLCVGAGLWWTNRSDGRFHLLAPALRGDGFLLRTPGGRIVLIDGGTSGSEIANWLGHAVPLGRRDLDMIVLTRDDPSTITGLLAAVRRYRIRQALLVRPDRPSASWTELLERLHTMSAQVHFAHDGDRLLVQDSPTTEANIFEVLTARDGRLTLNLKVGSNQIMFLHSLPSGGLSPHLHGPVAALTYPWRRTTRDAVLQRLAPQMVIFGEQPGVDPELTMADRRIGGARLLHEALDGSIDLRLTKDKIDVKTEKYTR